MFTSAIDHIVIGSKELDSGTDQIEKLLDCKFLAGGKHTVMATHNRLLKLQENTYVEVISTDPDACPPSPIDGRKRWFSLDATSTHDRLARSAQPLTWVVAVSSIDYAKSNCGYDPGEIIEVSRGDLTWRLTVPVDGNLIEEGVLPSFIEWPGEKNPAHLMPESGVILENLVVSHPNPEGISAILENLNFNDAYEVTSGKKSVEFHFVKADGNSCVLRGL
jgi:hypothetical protein